MKTKLLIKIAIAIGIIIRPIMWIGRILYHLSLIIRALGYILMLMPNSAKGEFRHFWEVWGCDL